MVNSCLHRALDREVRGRTDRRHDSHRRSQRDGDRRARASGASRRHHAGDAAHAVRAVVRRRGRRPARWGSPARTPCSASSTSCRASTISCSCSRCSSSRSGGWKLVKTVTAFTVSHSITLTLATLGYVHVPQRPVEAVIALSIVFVAAEILHARAGRPGLTARAPWVVALTFGLMHGLGFASGLSEAGLPDGHIPTALLFFSLGVEAGHFLFIGVVLSLVALGCRRYQHSGRQPGT